MTDRNLGSFGGGYSKDKRVKLFKNGLYKIEGIERQVICLPNYHLRCLSCAFLILSNCSAGRDTT